MARLAHQKDLRQCRIDAFHGDYCARVGEVWISFLKHTANRLERACPSSHIKRRGASEDGT